MEDDRRLSLVVGIFVAVCVGAGAVIVLSLGSQSGVFTPQYHLIARFRNVQGLLPGAPVWLAGTQVGSVRAVELVADERGLPVRVDLRIDTAVQSRVRADSRASIGTIGLLGDSYVELTVGSQFTSPLLDGAEIETDSPSNLAQALATGTRALDSIAKLATNLDGVVAGFAERGGGERAAAAVEAASDLMLELQDGRGLLHSLIYDEYSGGGVESVQSSLASLEKIMTEIREGEGVLHSLIYDAPQDQDVVMQALEAGAKVNSIMGKVNSGEGTLGLLVNDPALYEDLTRLVGGANRSVVVRTLIRMATDEEQ